MKPLVAIVGRPNVGKSTFFNRMIGDQRSIVQDEPHTTRDRVFGDTEWNGRVFTLIDTGGLELSSSDNMLKQVHAQVKLAIQEAVIIVFICDVETGVTSADGEIADMLRRSNKPVLVAVNKSDNIERRMNSADFYELGFGEPIAISSRHGAGTGDLLSAIVDLLPLEEEEAPKETIPHIAIVGRPNVGKSSLLNAILGEDRVIVSDTPGTTRDAIDTRVEHNGTPIMLIDTAGVRRRGQISPGAEKFSVLRSARAIERSDVVLLLIDSTEGITAQDTHIAGIIRDETKGVVVVFNKWDIIRDQRKLFTQAEDDPSIKLSIIDEPEDADKRREHAKEDLKFIPYAPVIFASAKTKFHVPAIIDAALQVYANRQIRIPTAKLNTLFRDAVQRHPPAPIKGRNLKFFYATQGAVNPPTFILFVNDPELMHFGYERYLENQLRKEFPFAGTPIKLVVKAREQTT